jgi:hypothetical protein
MLSASWDTSKVYISASRRSLFAHIYMHTLDMFLLEETVIQNVFNTKLFLLIGFQSGTTLNPIIAYTASRSNSYVSQSPWLALVLLQQCFHDT